jgi:nucleoredoxin
MHPLSLALALALALSLPATAGVETWTNKDGKQAKLEFVKLTEKDGEKAGEFRMVNGRQVIIKATDLAEDDAKRLDTAKAADPKEAAGARPAGKDVFGEFANKGLLKLEGNAVKPFVLATPPKKYYVLYYSASWCGPCRQVTPVLVKWYTENKTADFEFIHVSNDENDAKMKGYMEAYKMPWPAFLHSVLGKEGGFGKYRSGNGIPHLSIVKTDGTLVTSGHPGNLIGNLKTLLAN